MRTSLTHTDGEDNEEHSKELADFMKVRNDAKKTIDELLNRY